MKYFFDFKKKILGRECSKLSLLIKRNLLFNIKFKVIIINYDKFIFSGSKMSNYFYYKHTGYIGNLKKKSINMLSKKDIFYKVLKGMLPKFIRNSFFRFIKFI
ncbi:MAG: uL13 family ribosomal protein [Candidatus Vidania fulgoroideorum]